MAQKVTSQGGADAHPKMGTKAQGPSLRLFPAADEDQVGKLQPSTRAHTPQHGASEEPKDLLEYVIAHEMVHLIEPTHSDRFIGILEKYYPTGAKPEPNSTNYR
jgi:metallopeptidase YgjP-like protein